MLFTKAVTIRHTLLAAGAVLVLGMAIYLVREVSRTPTDAQASRPRVEEPAAPTTTTETKSSDPPRRAALPTPPPKPAEITPAPSEPPERTAPVADVPPPLSADILPAKTANPKLDAVMAEANRAYDQGEFDEAKQIALKVLAKVPNNVRMLRIVVSSECIAGDAGEAQKYFTALPPADRAQMRTRCDRYGVTLKDP